MVTVPDVGSRVGSYTIQRELGHGGMGYVFLADHVSLGRKAALKLLTPQLARDESFRERFVRESRLIAAIEHPNMIPIYDAGEADGLLFIAMRYVDGCDLNDLIARGVLEPDGVLEILSQAAAALDAAHAREIVHRDVKPANILIDEPSGRTFLTDFGIAKQARTQATQAGLFVGTVDYASPEQIQGEAIGVPTDVYALGCVLYETLTGERPYPKETDVAVVYAHLRDDPPRVTAQRPELSAGIDTVVSVALAKTPSERYRSCGELMAAAREALQGSTTIVGRAVTAAAAAIPARSPVEHRPESSLPPSTSPLLGRDTDVEATVTLVRDEEVRLVTLTGAGGTGKTRLGLEVAAQLQQDFQSVCFAPLAPINDPALVLPAIAGALGVDDAETAAGTSLLDAIERQCRGERLLLFVDNFEHVLPAAPVVTDLLRALPKAKVLATSRASLRIRHEIEHPIAPLAVPSVDAGVEALSASPAVQLFVERARDVKPSFALTEDNAGVVADICRRLDGLPLAIELAAARVKLLSPDAIAARLENRLQLLTGGARDLPSRHQTLRGTLDWSFDLLDPAAQALLARAAVFVDGFTLEAAEDVCAGGSELKADEVVNALSALVDESLVRQRDTPSGGVRFDMLETVREYGLFRLIERRELDRQRSRHAAHFVALAEAAEPGLMGPDQAESLVRLDEEAGNLRAAMTWSLDTAELVSGLRIAGAAFRFWSIRGHLTESRRWLEQALQQDVDAPAGVRAKAAFAAGYTALGQGDHSEAEAHFRRALELYRELGDRAGEASSLAQLSWLRNAHGDVETGGALAQESLDLAQALGEERTASLALSNLGDIAFAEADFGRAAKLYAEVLALRRHVGDRRLTADALIKTGRAKALEGQDEEAAVALDEGLQIARALGDGWTTSVALASLGFVAIRADDIVRAGELIDEALTWCRKRGDKRLAAECLGGLAAAAALSGDSARAASLWGAGEGLRDAIDAPASSIERSLLEAYLPKARETLGDEEFERERARGRTSGSI